MFAKVKGKCLRLPLDQILDLVDSDQTDAEKLNALGVEYDEEAKLTTDEEKKELTKSTKHTLQHNKIVDMMDNYGMFLDKDVKYLEYGAGRGE